MNTIYCLVMQPYWDSYEGKSDYYPRDYEQEGFIHATKGDDLLVQVANRVYGEYDGDLMLLVIDEDRVDSEVKYERASNGLLYPHIYGPLNKDAITSVKRMVREQDGWSIGIEL